MIRIGRSALAICTAFHILLAVGVGSARAQTEAENLARYERTQVQWGAITLTLPAQIAYATALGEARDGNTDAALQHLERATRLDPQFPDPYFTMSWLEFRRFSPDALFHFVAGIRAVWMNFHVQSLLAVNILLVGTLLLIMVASIVCIAFGIRYLPFVAYRVAELLSEHFNAAAARAAAFLLVLVPFAVSPAS